MTETTMTGKQYRSKVQTTAEIILDEAVETEDWPVDSSRFEDELSEDVATTANCHDWVINHGYALDILQHAKNDPEEWQSYVDPQQENNYRHVIGTMAFTAFRADLYQYTFDLLAELREEQ